jgi:hypothetical protein
VPQTAIERLNELAQKPNADDAQAMDAVVNSMTEEHLAICVFYVEQVQPAEQLV